MTIACARPWLTFYVISYNQAPFVRQAVEGAFRQIYSPLQIILSDDGSTDGTFEIMRKMVAEYSGPHEVVLNRNEPNRGLAGNINRVMELARGELVFNSGGDDVSRPTRVEQTWQAWEKAGCRAGWLYGALQVIDEAGRVITPRLDFPPPPFCHDIIAMCRRSMDCVCVGASGAWARDVFQHFGPLAPDVCYEDRVLPLRCLLLGRRIAYVPDILVAYRRTSVAVTAVTVEGDLAQAAWRLSYKWHRNMLAVYRQWLADFAKLAAPPVGCEKIVERLIARSQLHQALATEGFIGRSRAYARALIASAGTGFATYWFLHSACRPLENWWLRRRFKDPWRRGDVG
jgi:glycosyltransferase involved in cell wall biosynthesis